MSITSGSNRVASDSAVSVAASVIPGFSAIQEKMARFDKQLPASVRCGVDSIDRVAEYALQAGGKRLRPAVLLLVSQMLGEDVDDRDIRYAVILEMLHMATLVHDDVIDGSPMRHNRPSINARWGNTLSVLFGDLMFTESIDHAIDEGNLEILKLLSVSTQSLVIGQILELEHAGTLSLSKEMAIEIIRRKTAALFTAACVLPAYLNPLRTIQFVQPLMTFGREIGTAFQLMDDLLDYTAREACLGKPVLSDLREGKLTMPLVIALAHASVGERALIATVLRQRGFDEIRPEDILDIAITRGGLSATRTLAKESTARAREALTPLPQCAAKSALLMATDYLASRTL